MDTDISLTVLFDTTTDGVETEKRTIISIPYSLYEYDKNNLDDYVSEHISDKYGWLVLDWKML